MGQIEEQQPPVSTHYERALACRAVLSHLTGEIQLMDVAWADMQDAGEASMGRMIGYLAGQVRYLLVERQGVDEATSGMQRLVAEHTMKAAIERG